LTKLEFTPDLPKIRMASVVDRGQRLRAHSTGLEPYFKNLEGKIFKNFFQGLVGANVFCLIGPKKARLIITKSFFFFIKIEGLCCPVILSYQPALVVTKKLNG